MKMHGPKIQKNKILKNFKKYYIIYIEKRKENHQKISKIRRMSCVSNFRNNFLGKILGKNSEERREKFMSAYLEIKAKPKHVEMKGAIKIGSESRSSWVYRALTDYVPGYSEMAPLSTDVLEEGIRDLREDLERIEAGIKGIEEENERIERMGAKDGETLRASLDLIRENIAEIREYKEEKEDIESAIHKIHGYVDLYEMNKEDWDFWIGVESFIPGERDEED